MTQPPHEAFRIDVVAAPSDVPAAVRLTRFLKNALRTYGLRCVGLSPLTTTPKRSASGSTPDERRTP